MRLTLYIALMFAWSWTAFAVVAPDSLEPGDEYHLVFVTDGVRDGELSEDIADYNHFVQAEAARNSAVTGAGRGVDWFVIGSTPAIHARENALVEAPVFLLDGTRVADGFDDMWDGNLQTPINMTQFLVTRTKEDFREGLEFLTWTGSQDDGFLDDKSEFGNSRPMAGRSDFYSSDGSTRTGWLQYDTFGGATELPFYALSSKLTVVPEPSAFHIAVASMLCLIPLRRVRSRC